MEYVKRAQRDVPITVRLPQSTRLEVQQYIERLHNETGIVLSESKACALLILRGLQAKDNRLTN